MTHDKRITMPKSKCEKQLEAVTAERDHWKRLADERAERIAALERRVERAGMYSGAFGAGMQDLDRRIDTLQKERDEALAKAEQVLQIAKSRAVSE